MLLVPRGHYPRQRRQRCPHNIHAAHQFIGLPVRVHFVHKHRQHLERLRQRPRRQRESALNVVEVQSIRFALLLHFFNQLLPYFRFRYRLCRSYDQVSLAARWHSSRLVSSMSVRLREILHWHSRHQKILQHAVFDHFHAPRRLSFIVKIIRARQFHTGHLARRRVVNHAQKFWQHFLPDLFRERLSFFLVALPVAFQSVPQHFMEKHCRRAPAQHRRPIVRLRHRSLAQCAQVPGHFFNLACQFRFARQAARRRRLESFHAQQIHSVFGAYLRLHNQPRRSARRHDGAPFARNHPRIRSLHLNHHRREVHFRIFPERPGQSLDLAFPCRAIERSCRRRFLDVRLRFLLRKVRRLVLFFRANRRVRPHVQQRRHRPLVFAVR